MKDDASKVFSGDVLRDSPRKLVVASDYVYTLTDQRLRPRENFIQALLLLKLAGHDVYFLSSRANPDIGRMYRKFFLPEYSDLLGLDEAQREIILSDDFFDLKYKPSWRDVTGVDHIDLVFDDQDVKWCQRYSIHLRPDTQGFDTFVQALLSNPNQDVSLLAWQCAERGGTLGSDPGARPSDYS